MGLQDKIAPKTLHLRSLENDRYDVVQPNQTFTPSFCCEYTRSDIALQETERCKELITSLMQDLDNYQKIIEEQSQRITLLEDEKESLYLNLTFTLKNYRKVGDDKLHQLALLNSQNHVDYGSVLKGLQALRNLYETPSKFPNK